MKVIDRTSIKLLIDYLHNLDKVYIQVPALNKEFIEFLMKHKKQRSIVYVLTNLNEGAYLCGIGEVCTNSSLILYHSNEASSNVILYDENELTFVKEEIDRLAISRENFLKVHPNTMFFMAINTTPEYIKAPDPYAKNIVSFKLTLLNEIENIKDEIDKEKSFI